ncbi:putative aldolase class 2 protein CC_1201 [Panulirus ornatus]|uniref:putative aldolase class 2 protein CC_1201 n=1 Tax=Panulirus ornatus TaxID=150431 RepID=UPI003A8433AE
MWALSALRRGRTLVRTFTSAYPKPYTVPEGNWGTNRAARLELAASFRGLDKLGLNEGVCNHLSVMVPRADGQGETMLVGHYGLHWQEVTASNLLEVDWTGQTVQGEGKADVTAACIHLGIRHIRPDAKVIMHTHQPYATALACMKDPRLLMVHQNSLRFYQNVAYDTSYTGFALALEEGKRLGRVLGEKNILFMGNHGVVSVAKTISMAFDNLYYLERAAMMQVLAAGMEKEVALIPDSECGPMLDAISDMLQEYADAHFYSNYRILRKSQPEFEL